MKASLRHNLFLLSFIVLAINGVLALIVYKSNTRLLDSEQWVQHTGLVINKADDVLAISREIETATAGFVITRDKSFLGPLYNGQKTIFVYLQQLKNLTADNPSQQKRIDSLDLYIKSYLAFSLITVEKRAKQINGPGMAYTAAKQGKLYTDDILQITHAIQQEENRLLIKRKQISNNSAGAFDRITKIMLVLMATFTCLLLIVTVKYLRQHREKEKRAAELAVANEELSFQNEEKEKRAAELVIANEELSVQNIEKAKRAGELVIANKKLSFQNIEKEKRASELVIANKELFFQNTEKESRAAELVIANDELFFQNAEKEKRANELIIANLELLFQNQEKESRAAELVVANEELLYQNQEKEKRAAELKRANRLYAFISEINQNIVREKDESGLFSNACSIAHDFGKFKMAWIGLFNDDDTAITQIAQSGIPKEAIAQFKNVPLLPGGPQNRVLFTGEYFVCNDIMGDVELESWSALAAKQKVNSCIILPIKKSAKIIGTFNLYAADANFFNKEELALLVEVTGDISFALDMFEREKVLVQTQELVIENEKRFHSLIENSADMITLSKVTGEFIYASGSIIRGLGYSVDELLQMSVFDIIHPDDIPRAIQNRDIILKTPGQSYYYQQRRKHKNGAWIWCEGSLTNMLNEPGIHALVSNFRDVSEKKAAEIRKEYDKNNMDALMNNSNDLMWSIDKDFRMITSNAPFDDFMKENAGKTVKRGVNILKTSSTDKESDLYKSFYERAFAGESFTEIVYHDLPINTWAEISFCPIRDADEVIGTACHSHDITDRVNAAWKLSQSEIFNRGVLNSLSSHVAVLDKQGRIVAVNESWNHFSIENGETVLERTGVGSNYFEVCKKSAAAGEEIAIKTLAGMKAVISGEIPVFNLEYPCHSPETKRWFAMQVMKFESDDSMIVVSHQDISKRKIAEENLIDVSNSHLKTLNDLNKIMDSSLDIICSIDGEGTFVSLSEATNSIWGYKPGELIGKKFIDFVFKDDVENTEVVAAEIIGGSPVTVFENRYVHKNGSIVPMLWSATWDENDQLNYCIAKDATEKKRLENAFTTEKERFYHFFLSAPTAIGILKGPNHVYEMVNPIYLQLIGKKNIVGKTVYQVMPEVKNEGFIEILDEVYKTGKAFSAVERLVKLDLKGNGVLEEIYLNISYQAYRNSDSVIEGIFFFAVDVTEQVTARKKTEATEVKYRQIVETAQEGIWLIDKDEKTTFANEKMCEILEYSQEEMIGRTRLSFKDEEASKIGLQHFIAAATTSVNEAYDTQFITKSGRRIWAHVSLNPVYENDVYCGLLAMITDITERKAIEERLAANELRLTEAQDLAHIGNFEINLINSTAEWSDQVYKILGTDKNDIFPAATFSKFVHPEDLAAATEAFHSNRNDALDFRLIGKDGKLIYVSTEWKFELDGEGKPLRLYGVLQDITERKQGEIDRKNLVKDLLLRNTELEQFAFVASHDLQEPLRMITSFMTQLDKKYSAVIDDKGRKYIYFAVDGAKRMRQIILDLLDYSSVGKTDVDLEEVDINVLINEILALYRRQIEDFKAGITFKNLPTIKTYKTPLRQVFQNLIGNGLKYRKAGVRPLISITCTETKEYYRFAVSDNGIGIPPEYLEKIFIIFQRLHNKDEYSGTGMGLAIVKKIVEKLGGSIWLESTEGLGSTFYFTMIKIPE